MLSNVVAEVYHQNGDKVGEYQVDEGIINLEGIDRRASYFLVLKGKEFEMIQSSFNYEDSGQLFAQSFYNGKVDVYDTINKERVSTAELRVQCLGGVNYLRKYTSTNAEGYRIKYPRNSNCMLSIYPVVNENYYDIEFNDVLKKEDNSVVNIKLKRYNKIYGNIVGENNKPLKNKTLKFKGKKTKTDEFGYYEFKFKKGEIIKVNISEDFLKKNKVLNGCSSESNFMTFSQDYLSEKKNNIFCKKK